MKNKKNRYYDLCCVLPSDDDLEESKVLFAYSTSNIKSLILSAIMGQFYSSFWLYFFLRFLFSNCIQCFS